MIEDRPQSAAFREVVEELLSAGVSFRFQARGRSMLPVIHDGDILHVKAVDPERVRVGEIVLFRNGRVLKAHRVVRKHKDFFVTRGDAGLEADDSIQRGQIVGKIIAKECAQTGRVVSLDGFTRRMRYFAGALKRVLGHRIRRARFAASHTGLLTLLIGVTLLLPVSARAQQTVGGVALDTTSSKAFTVGGSGSTKRRCVRPPDAWAQV